MRYLKRMKPSEVTAALLTSSSTSLTWQQEGTTLNSLFMGQNQRRSVKVDHY